MGESFEEAQEKHIPEAVRDYALAQVAAVWLPEWSSQPFFEALPAWMREDARGFFSQFCRPFTASPPERTSSPPMSRKLSLGFVSKGPGSVNVL